MEMDVFEKVLSMVSEENPNALFLLGPFVPDDNSVIETGILKENLSYDEFFFRILDTVNRYFKVYYKLIFLG